MTVRDSRSCGLIEPAGGRAKSICVFVVSLHRINNQDIEENISNIMTIFFFSRYFSGFIICEMKFSTCIHLGFLSK